MRADESYATGSAAMQASPERCQRIRGRIDMMSSSVELFPAWWRSCIGGGGQIFVCGLCAFIQKLAGTDPDRCNRSRVELFALSRSKRRVRIASLRRR